MISSVTMGTYLTHAEIGSPEHHLRIHARRPYDRSLGNIVNVQKDVATEVTKAVRTSIRSAAAVQLARSQDEQSRERQQHRTIRQRRMSKSHGGRVPSHIRLA